MPSPTIATPRTTPSVNANFFIKDLLPIKSSFYISRSFTLKQQVPEPYVPVFTRFSRYAIVISAGQSRPIPLWAGAEDSHEMVGMHFSISFLSLSSFGPFTLKK